MNVPATPAAPPPWHREPLMWLVVAVPLATVVAGFVTLFLAARGSDEVVRDDYRKAGLAVESEPGRDAAAAAAGAKARLQVDAGSGRLRATLVLQDGVIPDTLQLLLTHATRADLDRLVTLRRDGPSHVGLTERLPAGHWFVELGPPDRRWRLRGEFRGAVAELQLAPPAGL